MGENEKKNFYRSLFILVLPITLQNLISALSGSADVVMLGYVNQEALSAVSLASQITFVFNLLLMGLSIGAGMLTSQYWGRKDCSSIEKVLGIAVKLSALIGVLFFMLTILWPDSLMKLFTPDSALITQGAAYLKAVGVSYIFMSISQIYLAVIRSKEDVKISSIITIASLFINIILNAVFIFGLFGMPRLEIRGVALATVIARGIELLWCVLHAALRGTVRFRISYILHMDKILFQDFFHYTLPVLGNEIVWGVAFTSFSAIIGHVNSDFVAANSVASVVKNLAIALCTGLAGGGTVLIGKHLGENDFEGAKRSGARLCRMAIFFGAIAGMVILLAKPAILHLVTLSEAAGGYLNGMLYICAYYCIGKSVNIATIGGIFCAGGDSRFGFKCDAIVMWLVILPLGLLAAFVVKLPPVWIYFVLSMDEFVKIPFVYRHYKKYNWVKNITRDMKANTKMEKEKCA